MRPFSLQIIQAKAAIERQQAKIRSLIEEQADRVEAERVAIEKRAGEQVRAAREEAARQAQEATRLEMEVEKQVGDGGLPLIIHSFNQTSTFKILFKE